ncbi:queuosine precursor transporter [Holosporaceae bacterium 'Namur']|nr:queuosine precursor transporter [Holosporaceae bacterium 'Namur']
MNTTAKMSYQKNTNSLLVIGVLFSAFLILSNLAENKICEIYGFYFAGGLVFFPLTYIFDDVLTEVYGFKVCRKIIWLAFFSNLVVIVGLYLVMLIKPAAEWQNQEAFDTIYHQSFRVLLASFISFLFGEFINAFVLAKLKIKTKGKHFWFRAILSSALGVFVENTIFCFIAFLGIMEFSVIWNIIITGYLFKLFYEIVALPLTYKIVNFLKNKDGIDYYDYKTSFNPFSISN